MRAHSASVLPFENCMVLWETWISCRCTDRLVSLSMSGIDLRLTRLQRDQLYWKMPTDQRTSQIAANASVQKSEDIYRTARKRNDGLRPIYDTYIHEQERVGKQITDVHVKRDPGRQWLRSPWSLDYASFEIDTISACVSWCDVDGTGNGVFARTFAEMYRYIGRRASD